MNKQEEIREGIERILDELLFSPSDEGNDGHTYKETECIDNLLNYLHTQGVVLQYKKVLPDNTFYITVELLIKEG